MADLTITATDVIQGTGAVIENGTAGGALTAGMSVYQDSADGNKWKAADANASSATAAVKGIALNGAASGQPVAVQKAGAITLGNVLTTGKVYVQSATPGGIAPVADLAAGWRTSLIGVALSATSLQLNIYNSDTAN